VTDTYTWSGLFGSLIGGTSLPSEATAWAMEEIMAGNATPAQIAAFAVLLRAKGETPEELAGLVGVMRDRATPVRWDGPAVDVVGSGRTVIKHGNRAASSLCGTADVLEELGVVIDLPASGVEATVAEVGIGFCFAPVFHSGMRHAGAPRRELATPTFFNFLGPLTNPARVRSGAIGCGDARMAPLMAQVLAERGDTAVVFRGDDGLDELTTTTTSRAWVVRDGAVTDEVVDAAVLGIKPVLPEQLRGGDRAVNAAVVREVLAGRGEGVRDAVLLNAAAAIAAYDGFPGTSLAESLSLGLTAAAEAVDTGAAATLLERWIDASHRAAH
jgi:anthranilate phosphoribosyltransferase